MIALLVLAANVFENIEPRAGEVSIQAMVRLPNLDDRDTRALQILADVLPQEVDGYSRRDMMTVTSGSPIRCVVEADHLRIVFSVAPANEKVGLSLLEGILRRSKISDASVRSAVATHRDRDGYWSAALNPVLVDLSQVRGQDVLDLYQRLIQPESVTIAVGGPVVPRLAQEEWSRRTALWTAGRRATVNPYRPPIAYLTKNPGEVSTLDLASSTFSPTDAALPTRLLALVALGSGKGSSLFRVVRQQHGISYRQEALLSPTPEGFQSRILIAMKPDGNEAGQIDRVRNVLAEDIRNWSDEDLRRAVGMAEAALLRVTEFSPLALSRLGPVTDDLEGRTFLRAYWPMKTGQPWDPGAMLDSMRLVSLDDLKRTASDIVLNAKPRLLSGVR